VNEGGRTIKTKELAKNFARPGGGGKVGNKGGGELYRRYAHPIIVNPRPQRKENKRGATGRKKIREEKKNKICPGGGREKNNTKAGARG